jgi:hypothetical protein
MTLYTLDGLLDDLRAVTEFFKGHRDSSGVPPASRMNFLTDEPRVLQRCVAGTRSNFAL